jgi:hypothetical protein
VRLERLGNGVRGVLGEEVAGGWDGAHAGTGDRGSESFADRRAEPGVVFAPENEGGRPYFAET